MLKPRQTVRGVIRTLDQNGNGVMMVKGDRVIVPGALAKETVDVQIEKVSRDGYIARLRKVVTPSLDRCAPACPHAGRCGGCRLMHMRYEAGLRWKKQQVLLAANKAGLSLHIHDVVKTKAEESRNKVIVSFGREENGRITAGLYEESSHRIVAYDRCLLHPKICDDIIQTIRKLVEELRIAPFDIRRQRGFLRHVQLRYGKVSKEILVTLVVSEERFPARKLFIQRLLAAHPQITGVVMNINPRDTSVVLGDVERVLYGNGWISDELLGLRFRISSSSFYQINHDQCERLYQKAYELLQLRPTDRLLDAYCGIGTISLCAAKQVKEVIGVELNAQAVTDARMNAKYNHITNARYIHKDASRFLLEEAKRAKHYDAVLLDPPREGSTKVFLDACAKLGPEKIVYISCNPLTQVRDLRILQAHGYVCKEMFLYDMFAMSAHVESVVLMSRKDA